MGAWELYVRFKGIESGWVILVMFLCGLTLSGSAWVYSEIHPPEPERLDSALYVALDDALLAELEARVGVRAPQAAGFRLMRFRPHRERASFEQVTTEWSSLSSLGQGQGRARLVVPPGSENAFPVGFRWHREEVPRRLGTRIISYEEKLTVDELHLLEPETDTP